MKEKQSQKDRIKEITEGIEQGIKEMFQSDHFRQYLKTMSRFHNYSVNNIILIQQQCPQVTHVAGFTKWKNDFGRNVRKGEKGIRILAPAPFKKKVEMTKIDPQTRAPALDASGNVIKEEKEVKIPYFKVVSVFDVSQTDGRPLPAIVSTLDGRVERYDIFLEALKRSSPVPIGFEQLEDNLDGFFSLKNQAITLREGMGEVQTVCAAVHEIAHAMLHNYAIEAELEERKSRRTQEVEAESVAYAVCQYFNIETADNSFGYIASWSQGKDLKELRESLETINTTASQLITDMEHSIEAICKERGIDLTAKQEETLPEYESEALYLVNDEYYLHVQKSEGGWDYTIYNAESLKLMDGGFLEDVVVQESPIVRPLAAARTEIMELEGIKPERVIYCDLAILEQLREAQEQFMTEAVNAFVKEMQTRVSENVPDPTLTEEHMHKCGFTEPGMWPISEDRAKELAEMGIQVYALFCDGLKHPIEDPQDICVYGGLYGVTKADWDQVKDTVPQRNIEQRFMERSGDMMAIYQLKETADPGLLFSSYEWLDNPPQRENYDCIYTREVSPILNEKDLLEQTFRIYNADRPDDFVGHSLSMSDIVALKRDGVISYHYCDTFGFRELTGFQKEDREPRRTSVLDQLKKQTCHPGKSAPRKIKEREI